MRFRPGGLWRHHNFLKLWSSHTVSQFGYQISFLAVPLLAVLVLDATPLQMGVLIAVGGLPTLFIGLLAGAWIDRRRRRPVLIAANWGRALLLLVIPITAWLGVLRIELLYLVAFGLGNLGLLFDVAHRSFLPSLVERNRIIEANSNATCGDWRSDYTVSDRPCIGVGDPACYSTIPVRHRGYHIQHRPSQRPSAYDP